jgi:hypothetical protein
MRKTKPIEPIKKLTPTQLAQLHTWFEQGVTYHGAIAKFQTEFGAKIKYHQVYKYFHIWQHATELYKHTLLWKQVEGTERSENPPSWGRGQGEGELHSNNYSLCGEGDLLNNKQKALLEIISLLQGEAAPFSELTHHLIQKAACSMAANPENTSMDLYRLMRLANNPLQQEYLRHRMDVQDEKIALQKRALDLRAEKQKQSGSGVPPLESAKTKEETAIQKSLNFRKYCQNHPVLKGIVAEPKTYEETAKENEELARTGTNTSHFRVVTPADSARDPDPTLNPAPQLKSPIGTPLKPNQEFAASWEPSITEDEKETAVLPTGRDRTIQFENPATWPRFYHYIQKHGNNPLLEYLCQNQIRAVTPQCFIPSKLLHSQFAPDSCSAEYCHDLRCWHIPFYLRHPIDGTWLGFERWDPTRPLLSAREAEMRHEYLARKQKTPATSSILV